MKINSEQIIKIIDFWQKSAKNEKLCDRTLTKRIDCASKEIIDLVGPRRSGKSSILKLIIQSLNLNGNFLFINFEDPFFVGNNEPQILEEIIAVFKEYFNPKLKYIFFDEIQEIAHWERILRKLRDAENFKIFITGSSSKLLSKEASSLLTGRHLSYQAFPLSFQEFLSFRQITLSGKKDFILKEKTILKSFEEYTSIGGFPEIVLTKNQELLKTYFFDILQRDIIRRYDIREKEILEKIAVYYLSNAGKIISIESLKNSFGVSFALASLYLEYLKEAFLIFELPQFAYSLKRQSKALKKIYSVDAGISNAASFRFSEDKGRILENVVFLELKRRGGEIYYYKTKNNLEADFLVKEKARMREIIQVAWSLEDKKTRDREIKNLLQALEECHLDKGLILAYNEKETINIGEKTIIIKPVWQWLLE